MNSLISDLYLNKSHWPDVERLTENHLNRTKIVFILFYNNDKKKRIYK